jgi:hypothetical protein
MRTHGIADFPDPDSSGTIDLKSLHPGPGSDLDPANSRFQAAAGACRSLQPPGFLTQHKPDQAQVAQEVKWARCMRAHGITGFPDPDSSGRLSIGSLRAAGFDPHSPQGESALKACDQYEPGSIHIAGG